MSRTRALVWDSSFSKAFKRLVRKNPSMQQKVFDILILLETDPSTPSLKAHKLKGKLEGLWACWAEYNCRIVYAIEQDVDADQEIIVLIDIGSHDEVY
jgi:mRNA interferase YafQ